MTDGKELQETGRMIDLQALVDGMSAKWQEERSESQMTLGRIIEILESMPSKMEIKGLGGLNSYRGYYCDLAFEQINGKRTVNEILEECKSSMGKVFQGYKGGDYPMHANTPLWLAGYGQCGNKLMGINNDGTINTEPDDD